MLPPRNRRPAGFQRWAAAKLEAVGNAEHRQLLEWDELPARLHPVLGEALAAIEVAVALTIIGTALFGSSALSERAFRLLRWIGNRPEPPVPPGRPAASPRRSP